MALGDILHALTDEDATFNSDGGVSPRTLDELPLSEPPPDGEVAAKAVSALTLDVRAERRALSVSLGTWSSFLAASADVGSVITTAAELAERLDLILWELRSLRSAVTAGPTGEIDPSEVTKLTEVVNGEIRGYNLSAEHLASTLEATIRAHVLERGSSIIER